MKSLSFGLLDEKKKKQVSLYKLGEVQSLQQRNDAIQSYQNNDLSEILENESMYHILNTLKLKEQ